jgi:hypothetical protein
LLDAVRAEIPPDEAPPQPPTSRPER